MTALFNDKTHYCSTVMGMQISFRKVRRSWKSSRTDVVLVPAGRIEEGRSVRSPHPGSLELMNEGIHVSGRVGLSVCQA